MLATGVLCLPLDSDLSPAQALLTLRDDDRPFCLTGVWAGASALLGSQPLRALRGWDELDVTADHSGPPPAFVGGGWFGVLGFGLGATIEDLPAPPPRPLPRPAWGMAYYDHVLRRDVDGRWWFEALVTPERAGALERRREELAARLAAPPRTPCAWHAGPLAPRAPGYAGHAAAVADCVERIAAGDLFQANLCLRFEGRLQGDPIDAFADAVARLGPAYGAYVGQADGGAVLSFSPELFLRRRGRTVETGPIKGTAERGGAGAETARAALLASRKDAAEHVMIVDLMRNDLGRVCAYGSVTADPQPRAEAHPGVWHLVSTVRGDLRDGATDADLLRATFPPGSVTGAPKVQSLKVISDLEATGREVYTGAIGFVSPTAGLELSVAIRTFETDGAGALWLGAGGGIVADSEPADEVREAFRKAAPLAAALGADLAPPPEGAAAPGARARGDAGAGGGAGAGGAGGGARPLRLVSSGLRPDPARGIFETVLVRDGEPVRLEAHLARLRASAAALYGAELPPSLAADARRAAAGVPRGRLRVTLAPDGGARLSVAPAGPPPEQLALDPVVLPGGLGAHKWADRRLVEALTRPGHAPLFVDLDGAVLEAGWASVWVVEGDALVTPPADGRILPSVTRATVLDRHPNACAEPVDLERLRDADDVVLTSAIALAAPATATAEHLRSLLST